MTLSDADLARLRQVAEQLEKRLPMVIHAAYTGSAEHGGFLRKASPFEMNPNPFMVLDQFKRWSQQCLALLDEVARLREDVKRFSELADTRHDELFACHRKVDELNRQMKEGDF